MSPAEFYDKHLKTFPAPKPFLEHEDVPFWGSLPGLLRATRATTGIDIRFIRAGGSLPEDRYSFPAIPVNNRLGKTAGHLVIYGTQETALPLSDREREAYTAALAELLGDAYRWQSALRQSEAEQASDVPVKGCIKADEEIFKILRDQLKQTSRVVNCQASALYILNREATHLKLRVVWGLPEEKLLEPARDLRNSLADMEALLGQAVILNDEFLLETWNPPEDFPVAVCVPIASDSTIHGTLWFFSDIPRDFATEELTILEIAAGRIATELEKMALVKEINVLRNSKCKPETPCNGKKQ
ncbi:MAG: GAF domain-containing protein [Planctomycetaceae bacterium]|nr:GAF domain-containing protein [Planctomycetaceae bacterium]